MPEIHTSGPLVFCERARACAPDWIVGAGRGAAMRDRRLTPVSPHDFKGLLCDLVGRPAEKSRPKPVVNREQNGNANRRIVPLRHNM